MPHLSVFQRTIRLPAPPEAVFAYHSDPSNLKNVLPPGQRLLHLETSGPAAVGVTFRLRISFFGFPLEWEGRWETVDPPHVLCDRALRSPFAHFLHRHECRPAPDGQTDLTERIEYALPGGLAGWLVAETLVRLQFVLTFPIRHRRMIRAFLPPAP